jgi:hypothetical protein
MGADKNSSRRRWRLQQDEHGSKHMSPTHYPSWPSPRSHWSATGPRNRQPTFRAKITNTHDGNLHGLLPVLHQSDKWPALVRPVTPVRLVDRAGQAGGCSSRTTNVQESLIDFSRPCNQNTPKNTICKEEEPFTNPSKTPPNRPRTNQQHHDPKTHKSSSSPEANPTSSIHRLDQSHTPVRPVTPGQLGMNSTRGSNLPNPNFDLSNRSTDLCKTLGIVGTPHGEFIAKLLSTKTRQIKRNQRNPAKNSSNPRAPKTPKSSPLTHGFGS